MYKITVYEFPAQIYFNESLFLSAFNIFLSHYQCELHLKSSGNEWQCKE